MNNKLNTQGEAEKQAVVSDIPRIITPSEKALIIFESFNYLAETRITKNDQVAFSIYMVDGIINACEYNQVESYNTDWWTKVKIEIRKLGT